MPAFGKMVHSWDYGIYRVKLDGEQIAEQDLYDPNVTPVEHKWGMRKLGPGVHTLRFECAGKSPKSKGYYLGFGAWWAAPRSIAAPPASTSAPCRRPSEPPMRPGTRTNEGTSCQGQAAP